MTVRANISRGYRGRLLLLAAVGLGFAGWSLVDGLVTYPRQRERAQRYQEFKKEERLEDWKTLAKERGWPVENPGEPHSDGDIFMQFVMTGIAAPVGLLFLFFYFRTRGRWIEADETGLQTSWGARTAFQEIVSLDKKRWRKKGIAAVYYLADGRKGKITLDDCNYEREPTEQILRAVESHLAPDQIVGGRPEPPREETTPEEAEG